MATRAYNFTDKSGNKFYKKTELGKDYFSKQYQLTIDGVAQKPKWTPQFNTTKKVLDFINDEKAKARSMTGVYKTLDKHSFRFVFDKCYEKMIEQYKLSGKSPRTIKKYETNIMKYVIGRNNELPYKGIGDMNVEDMTIMDVKNLKFAINKTYATAYSKDTIKHIFGHIDKTFLYARDNGWVSYDFCNNIKVSPEGKLQASKQAIRNFFSEKEYELFRSKYDKYAKTVFTDNYKNYPLGVKEKDSEDVIVEFRTILYRAFFSFVFYTGSRKGEARGCKWSDIIAGSDAFDLECIKIDSQYAEDNAEILGKKVHTKPKTDDSVRICTMHEQLSDDLKELKTFLQLHNLYDPEQYIFFDYYCEEPKPIPSSNINNQFNKFKALTNIENDSIAINGIERKITVHGMRHSACAMLLEKGMDKVDVAKFLGHKDTKMVEEVYMHFINPIDMEEERRKKNMQFFRKG